MTNHQAIDLLTDDEIALLQAYRRALIREDEPLFLLSDFYLREAHERDGERCKQIANIVVRMIDARLMRDSFPGLVQ